jgi:hypothetical protein
MKPLILGAALGTAVTAGVFGLFLLTSAPSERQQTPAANKTTIDKNRNQGVLDLICELRLDLDGQLALGITANEPPRMAIAQIDFEKNSGWYQGKIAISESRAGNLQISGQTLKVSRPAMFERFGVKIIREEFSVDRSNGEFTQSLTLQDGRLVTLIRGTCAKIIKPAF